MIGPGRHRGLSLRARLALAFLAGVALLAAITVIGLVTLGRIHSRVDAIIEVEVPVVLALEELRFAGLRVVSSTNEGLLLRDRAGETLPGAGEAAERERQLVDEGRARYERALGRYEAVAGGDGAGDAPGRAALIAAAAALFAASEALMEAGPTLAAKEDFEAAETDYLSVVDGLLAEKTRALQGSGDTLHSGIGRVIATMAVAGLVTVLLGTVLALRAARRIAAPLDDLASTLGGAALGTAPGSGDDAGALPLAVQRVMRDLRTATVSRDFLDAIVTSMNDSLVVLDTDSNVVLANEATCRLLGYREDELRGHPSTRLLADDSLRDAESTAEIELLSLLNGTRETNYQARDGSLIPVSVSGSVLRSASGRRLGGILVAQDIRERRRARAQLVRAKERAEAATRAKSRFLATMSHEIRTPMNGVLGMTDLLLGEELGHRQRGHVETIRRSGEALLTVINDILDFSKIEAGRLELGHEPYDPVEMVEDVATLLAGGAHDKGVELSVIVDAALPQDLLGDGARVRQVLVNLLGNAIKFTEDGEVTVHVAPFAGAAGEARWRVEVHDTGIGVPREALASLFRPFSQGDAGTARRFGGTGLGLAVSRHLVELMGGAIGVRSEAGKGSTFWFTLPLEHGEAAAASDALPDAAATRVLAILSHRPTRDALTQQLTRLGVGFEVLPDPASAFAWLREAQTAPDCILIDSTLPDAGDAAFARTLDAEGLAIGARRVALCRLGEETARAASWSEAGIEEHLTRPLRVSALRDLLARLHSPARERAAAGAAGQVQRLGARVLLVEDHPVNRDVVLSMLAQMGCEAAVEHGGEEALARLARESFDLVLMDCDMPGLDGFETTRRLRTRERRQGATRLPVIALTANALRGDRERCLAAGMDDYLSKPMSRAQLRAMVEAWRPARGKRPGPAAAATPSKTTPLDPAVVAPLRATGSEFFSELARRYEQSWDEDLEALREALASGDGESVRRLAHRLKSGSAMLGARGVSAACAEVEAAAGSGALAGVPALLEALEAEQARAMSALRELRRTAC